MRDLNIIGLCGHAGHGKDTLAQAILRQSDYSVTHFADALKKMCSEAFGLPTEFFYDIKLKTQPFRAPVEIDKYIDLMLDWTDLPRLPRLGKVAHNPRELLQYVGTEYVRSVQDDFWCDWTIKQCRVIGGGWVIADVRFADEARSIHNLGGIVARIVRDRVMSTMDPHPSEAIAFNYDVLVHVLSEDFAMMARAARGLLAMSQQEVPLAV